MTESQADVFSLDTQIQSVVSDSNTLDKIANVIESNIEEGLSSQAAQVIGVVTESIYSKYNLKTKLTPGYESFTEVSKIVFTSVALENVKEAIVKMWNLIVSAIKIAYNKVSEFLKKIFRSVLSVKQKAEKLKESIKNISFDGKLNETEISNSEDVATEDVGLPGNKKLSSSAITLIFTDKTDAPSIFRTSEALVKQLNASTALFDSVDKSVEITQTLLKEFSDNKSIDSFSYPTFTRGLESSGSDGNYRSEMFPGSLALLVKGAAEDSNFKGLEALHAIANTSIHIGPWNTKQQMVHHKTIPVLNKASIEKLLEDSIAISTAVEKI